MRRRGQQEFEGFGFKRPKDAFGGSLLKGNPKTKRPLESKLPILLTLRANKSAMRLPKTIGKVDQMVYGIAKKHGVTIYEYANVGNHLHILIKISRVGRWAPFIRELTGRIAQVIGLRWMVRPHTRIVRGWRKAYKIAKEYVNLNILEAEGFIKRSETRTLRDLRVLLGDG
jgi:hypothetical protein